MMRKVKSEKRYDKMD